MATHRLILGIPESGKTTLARWWCSALKRAGHKTVVFNPYGDPGWDCDFQSRDPHKIKLFCQQRFSKCVFLEEAGAEFDRDREFNWFGTGSRHDGNSTWIIAQSHVMIHPTLRRCCTETYMFRSAVVDCEYFADLYGDKKISDASQFMPGEFFVVSAFAPLKYSRTDLQRKTWPIPQVYPGQLSNKFTPQEIIK